MKNRKLNAFRRKAKGNMLILITALIVGIILGLLVFGLGFVRLLGTNQEHRTAIEAAALAAARDCTRIVIPTAEVGWVSLSDYVPNGSRTNAPDGYPLPVRSINTLIGTARLDLIIADRLNQEVMRELARMDMQDTLSAKDQLVSALQNAISPGGSGRDKDGNVVRPYNSAETAYQQNQVRMTGKAEYVAGSLNLQLGSLTSGVVTNIPVPEPQSSAPVPNSGKIGNFYKSYVNLPVSAGGQTTNFVFGAIGNTIRIVDHKRWAANIPSLPYQIPTVIRAEAQQRIADVQNPNGQLHRAVAAAQPASVFDPLPAPGALSLSFPDGHVPEVNSPGEIYLDPKMNNPGTDPADLLTAVGGDYPVDAGSNMRELVWPLDSSDSAQPTANIWRVALYDWIRRAGTKARITDAVAMQSLILAKPGASTIPATISWVAPLTQGGAPQDLGQIPAGIIHVFKWEPNGSISYQYRPLTPYPIYVSSHRQMYSETMAAIDKSSSGKITVSIPIDPTDPKDVVFEDDWDAYVRDEVRNRGVVSSPVPTPPTPYNTYGGKHAGEPLAKPAVAYLNPDTTRLIADGNSGVLYTNNIGIYGYGASGGKGKGKGKGQSGTHGGDVGFPPFVSPQDDFADGMVPAPPVVPALPVGFPMRPTYETTGTAVDFKLRRQIDVERLDGALGNTGYIGEVGQQLP